ncbi:nucleotidyl transferase AbiEii/AbiGii toxin family protein [Auritidibacter sp. NML100628]|uniref:nucleotidyl transferase AbiEii/AbiGii toxin family protein n=1 Tax=Auritidibacter sp. NML100628 TaxID=2170742 RepID=UPI000D72CD14|nr:nucleotidyl transferase AbiEii/AbiGii toxin family protein [Auritidibacter sp. NML100628]PXA77063.1 nucleotidyl transferase AbiEii/AbiGii toxin family protein [Auritidibacter sp. NML100628]
MNAGEDVFRRIQATARPAAATTGTRPPTQEYLIRHVLESFLDRLTRTEHAEDFVLKGGILLAAYGARRPTKDVDANAISANITTEHLTNVVRDIAAVDAQDGLIFETDTIEVHQIREHVDYPSLRIRITVTIDPWKGSATWDVSTGDPIVSAPRKVRIERILGNPIELLGYAPETTIAEKGVTILERGITSTRWRDYVDIVQLAQHGFDHTELLRSARAVARYRGVTLEPVAPHLSGYDEIGQAKWAAWRRKEGLEATTQEHLHAQVELVASYLDPVFIHGPA